MSGTIWHDPNGSWNNSELMDIKLNKQLRNARMWVDGHGFFRVEYNGGGRIILQDAVEMVETIGEFREALALGDKPH
jgi:hypothetical protein